MHEIVPEGLEDEASKLVAIPVESETERKLVEAGLASANGRLIRPRLVQAPGARLLAGGMWKRAYDSAGEEIVECRIRSPSAPDDKVLAVDWEKAPRFERLIDLTTPGAALFSFFLFGAAPKLAVVGALGFELRDTDRFLVNSQQGFAIELLEHLGVPARQVISRNSRRFAFHADELLSPLSTRSARYTPSWALDFVRGPFELAAGRPARRLYISREKAHGRRIINAEALERMLEAQGFTTVFAEESSMAETAAVMAEAAIVVSPHGAGLSNILWSPHAQVIELFGQHYTEQYRLLARFGGLSYTAFAGVGPDGRDLFALSNAERRAELTNRLDIRIDVDALARALDAVGSG